jgi:hypothetical protein
MLPIELFTPEEQAQIPAFKEKWRKIALSTERVDHAQAEAAIRAVYKLQRQRPPQIVFCDSPLSAASNFVGRVIVPLHPAFPEIPAPPEADEPSQAKSFPATGTFVKSMLYALRFMRKSQAMQKNPLSRLTKNKATFQNAHSHLTKKIEYQVAQQRATPVDLIGSIFSQIPEMDRADFQPIDAQNLVQPHTVVSRSEKSFSKIMDWYERLSSKFILFFLKRTFINQALTEVCDTRWSAIDRLLQIRILETLQERMQLVYSLPQAASGSAGAILDFCNTVIAPPRHPKYWHTLQNVYKQCGWIFIAEGVCYICDRPTTLKLDDEYRPHAEGEAAIEYSDGTKIYAYHGINMPEQYGQTLPAQWQAQWLLTETNAEIRRALIQGIGYDRLCQDLDAIELDSWAEYTLLKVKESIDVEDLHLLKMTCPSTGHIHAMRVPPDITSARDAIKWMNWDTDPQDFSVQT